MQELGLSWTLKPKIITLDEVEVPMLNITYLQGASMLRAL
jgi:hypothetical protein